MRISLISIFKPVALSIAAIAVMGLGQGVVRADEVTIAGYTNGAFNNPNPPNTSATQTASLFGLTYVNSTIQSGTTVNGFRGIGGNPTAPPTQNTNNLGAFNLANTTNVYTGNTFTLRVTFTLPTGINGGNTTLFSAMLVGSVTSTGDGGVQVDFNNALIPFTFSNAQASGSFFLSVNDLSIDPGQTSSVTGQITGAQQSAIPEPTSMLLLGTGLAGVAGAVRRKLKARNHS